MSASAALTLGKEERICSRTLIRQLFSEGRSRSMSAFPVRAVYIETERAEGEPPVQILVSVPKRCFKRAVKRNRVKRQIREAYRHHKALLADKVEARQPRSKVLVAFVWLDSSLHDFHTIETRVVSLLERISERL